MRGKIPSNAEMLHIQQLVLDDSSFPLAFEAELRREGTNGPISTFTVFDSNDVRFRKTLVRVTPMRNGRYRIESNGKKHYLPSKLSIFSMLQEGSTNPEVVAKLIVMLARQAKFQHM